MLKICLLVSTEYMNVTDGRTDGRTPHDGIRRSIVRLKVLKYVTNDWQLIIVKYCISVLYPLLYD